MTTTARSFGTFGTMLLAAMSVAAVLVTLDEKTLFLPPALILAAFGGYCAWAGFSGHIDQKVTQEHAEAVTAGQLYVAGVISGLVVPVIGFIVGIVLLGRGSTNYGLRVMIGSLGAGFLWYLFLTR